MTYTEKSIADNVSESEDEPQTAPLVDEEPSREDATPTEWATGIRTLRRSVIIHDTGHLLADFDELADRIDAAPADADVDDLIDQYDALAEQIKRGVRYVAEQRSQDWINATRKASIERHGFDADKMTDEQKQTVYYDRVAAQIVEPEGVTGETLAALYKTVPSNLALIEHLVTEANTTVVNAVESRDFSSRRSGKKSTKASSGR